MDVQDRFAPPPDEIERALLAAWRREEQRDPVERQLLEVWRGWQRHPATRPPWAAALRHRITAEPDAPVPASGLATRTGTLPEASSRLLGMLLGGLAGEQATLHDLPLPGRSLANDAGDDDAPASKRDSADHGLPRGHLGQRGSALLFVLEGFVRAHEQTRRSGPADPLDEAASALRRWLHARGVAWSDCGPDTGSPAGRLIEHAELWSSHVDEPSLLTAVSRMAAGCQFGRGQQPLTSSDAGTVVPLGVLPPLWSADPSTVRTLGNDLAALTHGHAHGHGPAAVLAVTTARLLRGQPVDTAIERGIAGWPAGREPLLHALHLGRSSPAGFRPGHRELAAMTTGRDGLGALAVAVRAAVAEHRGARDPVGFAAAVDSARQHDGDTATSAMLCGQLLGAAHGPTAIPRTWLAHLPVGMIEQLVDEAITEFGPRSAQPQRARRGTGSSSTDAPAGTAPRDADAPADTAEPAARHLAPTVTTATATADGTNTDAGGVVAALGRTGLERTTGFAEARDRFRAAVLGCAAGEALGLPITTDSIDEIRSRHGEDGLVDYVPAGHPSGRIGSDTQLLLFSVEGVIRGNIARRHRGTADLMQHLQHAYQRWLHTQHLSWKRAAGEFRDIAPSPDGWLVTHRALFHTRNPGRTMMRTLIAFAKGQQPIGSPAHPVSDSHGTSAVLRAVPAALWSQDTRDVFRIGTRMAALTHGHPTAYLAAGTIGAVVSRVLQGESLRTAVSQAQELLTEHAEHEPVSQQVAAAVRLAESGPIDAAELHQRLGSGWQAAEVTGLGLYAALVGARAADPFDAGLVSAVNHSGNSSTVGAICGSLLGAQVGTAGIAERWTAELELSDVLDQIATDAAVEFGPHPPEWGERYPAT